MTPRSRFALRSFAALTLATMLSLTSSIAFANWSTTVVKTASAGASSISLTSSGLSTLGPQSYTAAANSRVSTVTFASTGSAPLALSSVAVTGSGPLGSLISFAVWPKTGASCAAAVPPGSFSTTLANGTSAIASSFALTIPAASNAAAFCVATTFNGNTSTSAGQTVTPVVTFTAGVGANWKAVDSAAAANRTFTQSVAGIPAPVITGCSAGADYNYFWRSARITWTAPAGYTVSSYQVFVGSTLLGSVGGTVTQVDLNSSNVPLTGTNLPVTIRAIVGSVTSAASNAVDINSTSGIFFRNVDCS